MRTMICLAGLVLLGVSACAGSRGATPEIPRATPIERALDMALKARFEALDDAVEESETQRSYSVIVRHNPGRCGAPSQEIFVHGRWERVALTGRNDRARLAIQGWVETARQEPLARTRLLGRWDDRVWTSPGGVLWPVFEVSELDGLVALRDQSSSGEIGISEGEWMAARCAGAGSRSTP
jgi:hypothetical protein